ncbi:hypothetical protein EDF44_3761 [Rathayibacter sp. PhB185]|nr:hypothetical protein EDF45_3790 [Rathayibacter sp. PhB186]ROS46861.1 hypothetical protein EDF44_3761 [Rathayibacter sp. PhB185]
MIGARARAALLRGLLGQAGAVAGLLAVAGFVASAATVSFTTTVQRVIPAPPTLTTTAQIEGVAP